MIVARLIVNVREAAGLSQAELARRVGVPRSVMCVYESGKREPKATTLLRILAATGRELHVVPRAAPIDPACNGQILVEVIELAEELPYSPKKDIAAPILRDLLT